MSEIETGFGPIFPVGLFDVNPGTPLPPALPPSVTGNDRAGPMPPAVLNIAPGVLNQAVPQGDSGDSSPGAGPAEPGSTALTAEQTINHGFGLILLLVLIVLGLWLLFRSGQ